MTTTALPIRLSPDLCLPLDAVTETFAVMGVRGSGKSSTVKVLVEELTKAGQQCVVVDPTGVWFGLRSSADGKAPGLPFTVLGGQHGDLPLSPAAGEVIADLAVETNTPLVLDLSLMRKAEQRRFVLAFAETLYHRNRDPLMLVIDECDLFCPQRPMKGEERLLGAIEDLARRGRVKGLGLCAISQRPASVHKDVLSQASTLIAGRLLGVHDRSAIDGWTEAHGTREQRNEMMSTIASLATGEAWFWSPSWLNLFARVQVDRSSTFDSMATPKAGTKRVVPKVLSEVDVEALREKLAGFVAEAEANDPKVLKRRIAELERALADAVAGAPVERIVEVPVADPVAVAAAHTAGAAAATKVAVDAVEMLRSGVFDAVAHALASIREDQPPAPVVVAPVAASAPTRTPVTPPPPARTPAPKPAPARPAATGDKSLSKAEAAILNVLAQFPAGRTKVQLALLSKYSIKSSSLGNALGALRSAGYVEKGGSPIHATAEGIAAAGDVEPLPSGDELFRHWCDQLSKAEAAILTVMVDRYPADVTKEELADATGYSSSSSSMGNALGRLRSLELVDKWRANEDFVNAIR